MPTFLLRHTTSQNLSLVTGSTPFDVRGQVDPGAYEVCTVSDPAPVALVVADDTINAAQPLTMSPLYAGQTVADVAGFSVMTAAANFASTVGTVRAQDVTLTFQGDAVDATTVLAEGDSAGFTATVTSDAGTLPMAFVAPPISVAYAIRWVDAGDSTYDLDISPLVLGDTETTATITIDSVDYVYTVTRNEIAAGPAIQDMPALALSFDTIGVGGAPSLTTFYAANDSAAGAVSVDYTLLSDGVPVSGYENVNEATLLAYRITASEQGTDLTVRLDLTDTNGTSSYTTAAVAIPGAGALGIQNVGLFLRNESGVQTTNTFTVDLSPFAVGNKLLVAVGGNDQRYATSLTVDGDSAGAAIATEAGDLGVPNAMAVFEHTLDGNEGAATVIGTDFNTAANWAWCAAVVITGGGTRDTVQSASTPLSSALTLSATPTDADNVVIGLSTGGSAAYGAGRAWTSPLVEQDADDTFRANTAGGSIAWAENLPVAATTVQFSPAGSDHALVAVAYSKT